ncbi:hypothetical protein SD71_15430 [Cohnella kolymensis]|uniref:Bacterial Ig-like domain-containing protein n=1 Tax=Cohnella kolymensis TaxID=1590652 RepID=A0ABR5A3R5_9BACL|nr:immunoglobulin-like domain-containing protein [Cohnella kolymensis]KIL35052.1 hypothetical protein SD71_15430 [Cohnella kolymensis]
MRKISAVLAVLLISISIIGCGHRPNVENHSAEPVNMTSNESAPQEKKMIKWTKKEISEKTGYPLHSGEQFRRYLPPGFVYGPASSEETVYAAQSRPASEQGVYLQAFPVDKHIRVTLSEVDNSLRKTDEITVKEYLKDTRNEKDIIHKIPIRMAVFLPEKKDVLYTLVTELVEENGKVSDSIISIIYVPGDEINASVSTDKEVYSWNETMNLKLTNNGPTWLSFGVMYLLEKEDNGVWTPINSDWVWTLEGYSVSPESDFSQAITLDMLKPGKYRISKHVEITEGDYGVELSDTFEIK